MVMAMIAVRTAPLRTSHHGPDGTTNAAGNQSRLRPGRQGLADTPAGILSNESFRLSPRSRSSAPCAARAATSRNDAYPLGVAEKRQAIISHAAMSDLNSSTGLKTSGAGWLGDSLETGRWRPAALQSSSHSGDIAAVFGAGATIDRNMLLRPVGRDETSLRHKAHPLSV